jgi:hypothetical protein
VDSHISEQQAPGFSISQDCPEAVQDPQRKPLAHPEVEQQDSDSEHIFPSEIHGVEVAVGVAVLVAVATADGRVL